MPSQHLKSTIADLREKIQHGQHFRTDRETLSTRDPELDQLFPAGGIRRGSLVEWVGLGSASGAGTLSLLLANQVLHRQQGPRVVIDPERRVFLLPIFAAGGRPSDWILVRPQNPADGLWALEQALESRAVRLVWSEIDRLSPLAFRRLQIAAESSGNIGFLVRPKTALNQSSWADVRLLVQPRPSRSESPRFRIEVAYSKGPVERSTLEVEIDPHHAWLQARRSAEKTHLPRSG